MNPRRRHPDPELIALGVQQPWAELILRGVKTIEVRSQPTQIRGTIYLYTSKRTSTFDFAQTAIDANGIDVNALPKGLLVGTVDILDSRPCTGKDAAGSCVPAELLKQRQAWVLGNPQRLAQPLEVRFLPYGVWFYPFRRRENSRRTTLAGSRAKPQA
jgi:hypothetical protein